jgi:tRNA threonylcarbamoyladenosine biosynthesis protein TsaB
MNILAFDTCLDACSVAVLRSDTDGISAERALMRRGHAEALVPMIERTMLASGLSFAELDRVAVGHGPGTFTGTRVGMAAALGLGFAHGIAIVEYSSLQIVGRAAIEALGRHGEAYDGVMVARDARRDSLFVEIIDMDGCGVVAPALLNIDEARALAGGRHYFAVGSGVPLLAGDGSGLPDAETRWPVVPPVGIEEPDARHMLSDAADRQPAETPGPLYLRAADAVPSSVPPLARVASQPSEASPSSEASDA